MRNAIITLFALIVLAAVAALCFFFLKPAQLSGPNTKVLDLNQCIAEALSPLDTRVDYGTLKDNIELLSRTPGSAPSSVYSTLLAALNARKTLDDRSQWDNTHSSLTTLDQPASTVDVAKNAGADVLTGQGSFTARLANSESSDRENKFRNFIRGQWDQQREFYRRQIQAEERE